MILSTLFGQEGTIIIEVARVKHIDQQQIQRLQEQARKVRRQIIAMLGEAGSGHTGGRWGSRYCDCALFLGDGY